MRMMGPYICRQCLLWATCSSSVGSLRHIKKFTSPFRDRVQTHCLFQYNVPVSLHLAVQLSQEVG
jgi:hypothetical protein